MSIEAELYKYKGKKEDYLGSISVMPGSCEVINYLEPAQVLIMASVDGDQASVLIKGGNITAERHKSFEGKGDVLLEELDPKELITLTPEQEIYIRRDESQRSGKEIWIWIDRDNHEEDGGFHEIVQPPELILV